MPHATDRSAGAVALPGFCHLHLHSEYSLLDGGNRLDRLVARVKELGMDAVAVTDHGNIHGAVEFYEVARKAGIKPILGVEAYVAPGDRRDRTHTGVSDGGYHLVLLAENDIGWKNLLHLCSEAYLTGFYYKPRIDRSLLAERGSGLIAINGHLGSEIGEHLLAFERTRDDACWERALESALWHSKAFADEGTGPRFFIELQHHVPEQVSINPHLIRLARHLDLPIVCDNDAHFLNAEDHDAHDTLICISMGKNKNDADRLRYTPELYVKSPGQMRDLFEGQYGEVGREACDNTLRIAKRCNVTLDIGARHAPMVRVECPTSPPTHDDPRFAGDLSAWHAAFSAGFSLSPFAERADMDREHVRQECDRALRMLAEAGMVWRYGPGILDHRHDLIEGSDEAATRRSGDGVDADAFDKWARLNRELTILADKLISAYFLIVWDFVNWGRQRGIPANARGSGVGTMVGYVLGLSNACPVRYGLLFERFTDPDRGEYPDIDIDLCQDGRAGAIDYVRAKYGHVAQIITFGTLKAKAAIRDICRVHAVPLSDADKLAKMIPDTLNITLREALKENKDLRKLYDADAQVRTVIDTGMVLEGQARHAGVHAAGVVIANTPLSRIVPLYKQSGAGDHEIVTQWDGPTCEKMGLLKMDFLGLRTLSIIERCKALIRESLPEEAIWEAVGRKEEWQRGTVAKGLSDGRSPDSDVSRSDRLAARDGSGPYDLPRDRFNSETRDVRAGQPDASRGDIGADEHRGGIRQTHSSRIPAGAQNRDGLAVRTDDGLRDSDQPATHPVGHTTARTPRRGGSTPAIAHHEAGAQDLDHSATLPLCHSATSSSPHPLDLDRLTFDDPNVFALFQRGDTTGVFQFESPGMRRLLADMKPDRLEDLIAANALFRPGPMDLIPDYNRRKHGTERVPSVHPIVDRFTRETYGVMVYQEQVMQIVHELGGIPLRDAYTLIKAISKKNEQKIAAMRSVFVQGAQRQGLKSRQAEELFELINRFAGYGFNKSHSTGYAIIAYQTAYLKAYFPRQFMAAFLSYESQAQKVSDWIPYLDDCKRTRTIDPRTARALSSEIRVAPPSINRSGADFTVVFEEHEPRDAAHGHIRFGLRAIKGAGAKAIEAIIRERDRRQPAPVRGPGASPGSKPSHDTLTDIDDGARPSNTSPDRSTAPFQSLHDFCERVPQGCVNKATIEALIKSGAFDEVHGREQRAAMLASVDKAVAAAQKLAKDRDAGQSQLFAGPAEPQPDSPQSTTLERCTPWSEGETLEHEKQTLGFYVSSHPLETWRAWIESFPTIDIRAAREQPQDKRVIVAALPQSLREITCRNGKSKGQQMGVLTIEDLTGTIEVVIFADAFAKYATLARGQGAIFILGRIDHGRGSPQIVADQLVPIDGVPLSSGRLRLRLCEPRLNGSAGDVIRELHALLQSAGDPHAGDDDDAPTSVPVELLIETERSAVALRPRSLRRVRFGPRLARSLHTMLGERSATLVGGVSIESR